jgi:hypothetical protein
VQCEVKSFWARFCGCAAKTGLSAAIFWLRQKDFRFNPSRMGKQRFCFAKS